MRLIRFGAVGNERPGIVDGNGARRDTAAFGEDWNESFFGNSGVRRLAAWLDNPRDPLPVVAEGVAINILAIYVYCTRATG